MAPRLIHLSYPGQRGSKLSACVVPVTLPRAGWATTVRAVERVDHLVSAAGGTPQHNP